jgi:hypothetical protein
MICPEEVSPPTTYPILFIEKHLAAYLGVDGKLALVNHDCAIRRFEYKNKNEIKQRDLFIKENLYD